MSINNINKIGMDALKNAKACVNKKCKLGVGYCLYNVQEWYKSPHVYASAISQWNNIPASKKHINDKLPPNGVPVFFKGGNFGHIAVATGTKQNIVTTDYPNKGYVNISTIDKICSAWGYTYLGWSEIISKDTDIYTKAKVIIDYKTYKCTTKTKVFKTADLKNPLIKNGKKIYRKIGYKITAYLYNKNWLKTKAGNYYYKKRFK
jgi:surface antigen